MSAPVQPLQGWRIGLSVAGNGDDLARKGFTEAGMNRFTVRLSRALLAQGAGLAFGHDWRPEGVMEAVASIAVDYHCPPVLEPSRVAILNFLPWPHQRSETDPAFLVRLRGVVEVKPVDLPADLLPLEEEARREGRGSEIYDHLRARGLTQLRQRLTENCDARVAFGGKLRGYDGRLPGIVEEVYLALEDGQAVYVAGLLGGAAEALGRVLLEGADPAGLFEHVPLLTDLDCEALGRELASERFRGRLLANGLSADENRLLLATTLEEEAIALISRGLTQSRARGSARHATPQPPP